MSFADGNERSQKSFKKVTPEEENAFSEELKNFLIKSRETQTFYRNFEESHKRIVLPILHCFDTLKITITTTIYNENSNSSECKDFVDKIARNMISLAESYTVTEIHFSVIFIMYFDHIERQTKSKPVMKVYKSKTTEQAVFLDDDLKLHSCWNSFLDDLRLPPSLVCVPRNGVYSYSKDFDGLDLMYIVPRQTLNKSLLPKKSYMIYSEYLFVFLTDFFKSIGFKITALCLKELCTSICWSQVVKVGILILKIILDCKKNDYMACWNDILTLKKFVKRKDFSEKNEVNVSNWGTGTFKRYFFGFVFIGYVIFQLSAKFKEITQDGEKDNLKDKIFTCLDNKMKENNLNPEEHLRLKNWLINNFTLESFCKIASSF